MVSMRVPSHDADAEQSVLASMIFDNECISTISEILKPEDFYRPENVEIYREIIGLHMQHMPVDLVILSNALSRSGMLERIGGKAYFAEIAGIFYTSINAKHHALEIKRHSETRQIVRVLSDLIQKPESVSAGDLKRAAELLEDNRYIKSYAVESIKNIDNFKRNIREKKQRILTGFTIMDAIIGGLRMPSVAIIGAYPSVGKTAFALNISSNQDRPVVFFSLEMSSEMIYERLASSELKIDYNLFSTQSLSEDHYREIEAFSEVLKKKQFHVFDDMYYIEQQSVAIANIKPGLVVVDYIQKVKTHQKTDARRHEIDYISGLYKQIAKNNHCVILLLSQLSRSAMAQSKPTMSNLKESGALEADGDYVGILHRPYVVRKDEPGEIRPEDGYILIDKNKFGNTGQIDLYFDGKHQQFREVDKSIKSVPRTPPKRNNVFAEKLPVDDNEVLPFL